MKEKRGTRIIHSKTIDYENDRFYVEKYEFSSPTEENGVYYTVNKCDAVFLIAMNSKNEIYILREFRFPSNKVIYNLPAGGVKDEFSIEENALKELEEETNMTAGKVEILGSFLFDIGTQATRAYAVLMTDLDESKVGLEHLENDEYIESIEKFSVEKLKKMIINNEIDCGNSIAALNMLFLKKGL